MNERCHPRPFGFSSREHFEKLGTQIHARGPCDTFVRVFGFARRSFSKSDVFPAMEETFGDHVIYYRQPGDAARAVEVRRAHNISVPTESWDLSALSGRAIACFVFYAVPAPLGQTPTPLAAYVYVLVDFRSRGQQPRKVGRSRFKKKSNPQTWACLDLEHIILSRPSSVRLAPDRPSLYLPRQRYQWWWCHDTDISGVPFRIPFPTRPHTPGNVPPLRTPNTIVPARE